jgi:hypothetical protein
MIRCNGLNSSRGCFLGAISARNAGIEPDEGSWILRQYDERPSERLTIIGNKVTLTCFPFLRSIPPKVSCFSEFCVLATYAHDKSTHSEATETAVFEVEVTGSGGMSSEAWCLFAGEDGDSEEAELGVAKGCESTSLQQQRNHGIHSW